MTETGWIAASWVSRASDFAEATRPAIPARIPMPIATAAIRTTRKATGPSFAGFGGFPPSAVFPLCSSATPSTVIIPPQDSLINRFRHMLCDGLAARASSPPVEQAVYRRHKEQRGDGGAHQATNHRPAERGILFAALAQAQRH